MQPLLKNIPTFILRITTLSLGWITRTVRSIWARSTLTLAQTRRICIVAVPRLPPTTLDSVQSRGTWDAELFLLPVPVLQPLQSMMHLVTPLTALKWPRFCDFGLQFLQPNTTKWHCGTSVFTPPIAPHSLIILSRDLYSLDTQIVVK
jgi:hypothetical protein